MWKDNIHSFHFLCTSTNLLTLSGKTCMNLIERYNWLSFHCHILRIDKRANPIFIFEYTADRNKIHNCIITVYFGQNSKYSTLISQNFFNRVTHTVTTCYNMSSWTIYHQLGKNISAENTQKAVTKHTSEAAGCPKTVIKK